MAKLLRSVVTATATMNKGAAQPEPVEIPKLEKCTLIALEPESDFKGELVAQYNPKEIQIDKAASWAESKTSTSDQPHLEFTSSGTRSLSLELMFDTYEDGTDVHALYVAELIKLVSVMKPGSEKEQERRPPRVKFLWGFQGLPGFIGVIESVSTKYTMFLPGGRPVRATCTVKMKEANRASFAKKAR